MSISERSRNYTDHDTYIPHDSIYVSRRASFRDLLGDFNENTWRGIKIRDSRVSKTVQRRRDTEERDYNLI